MNEQQLKWSSLKVGIVVLIGLAIFVFIVSIVGTEQNIFASTYELKLFMPNVRGLVEGGMVTLGGLKIGYVTGLKFVTLGDTTGVDVTLGVLTKYAHAITPSSVAQIKTIGLLGDKYIDISIGPGTEDPLPEGSLLPLRESFDLEEAGPQLNRTLRDFTELLGNAREITETIRKGEGTVGQMISRPDLADGMNRFLSSLNSVMAEVERGRGTLGKLVYGDTLSGNIEAVSANLRAVTDRLRQGKGTAGRLIVEDSLYENLLSFSSRADTLMSRAAADSSNVSRLISDPAFYDQLNRLMRDLNLLLLDIRENPDRYVRISVF